MGDGGFQDKAIQTRMSEFAQCPHCLKPGIMVAGSSYYSRGWPAKCRECGGLAYDRFFANQLRRIPFEFVWLVMGSTFVVVLMKFARLPYWLALVIYMIGGFFLSRWMQRRRSGRALEFRPVTAEESQRSRRQTYAVLLLPVVVAVIWAVWKG
jgi:hypothetical protein